MPLVNPTCVAEQTHGFAPTVGYVCLLHRYEALNIHQRNKSKVPGDNNNLYPICGNYPAKRKI
jgi:hypothetical protein